MTNEHIRIDRNSYEKRKPCKYLRSLSTNQNSIQEEIKCRLKAGNSCYYSVQTLSSLRLLSKNLKIKIYKYDNIVSYDMLQWRRYGSNKNTQ